MIRYGHITDDVPLFTAAMSAFPYSPALEAMYKFKTKFDDDVNMSIKVGNTLMVPRRSCQIAPTPYDHRVSYPPVAIDCTISPRNEEQAALPKKSVDLLLAGTDHIFEAPTGWGKTWAGSVIAAMLGQPTLIVVTKQDLMDQWYDTLVNVLKIDPKLIGRIQQDTCDWQGKRIVIGMVHSLVIPDRYVSEMYKYFGFLLLDEVHKMAADCFIRICQMVPAKYRLGFSATPERQDGKTRVLQAHIGPVLVRGTMVPMKAKVLVVKTGWKIPTRKVVNDEGRLEEIPIPHAPGRMMLVVKAMASDAKRNQVLTNFVVQSHKAGRITLLLSDTLDHLKTLFGTATAAGIPGEQIAYYIGGLKKHELEYAHKRPFILGTYAMCDTGTNVPQWDTLVLGVPRAKVKQTVGRILRVLDGKRQPIVCDPVDHNSIFNSFYRSRLKDYYEIGAEIVQMK